MKVSVLVPVYNGERHLPECLDSILAQDFRDLEILISDDGSTDRSPEIIKDFAARDSRIRWWKNPCNLGLTANSNACLKEAKGEYIKFVHQDDKLLAPSAIRKLVAALDAHPAASLAGSQPHLTGGDSHPIFFWKNSGCYDGRQTIIHFLEQNANFIGQPTLTLFRRLQAQRGFDERFTGHMDYEMWCYLLEQGDFVYLVEPLATWRVHEHHQTARVQGTRDEDHLRFIEIYYVKPWLRERATDRMLFTQVYYLRKKYGNEAQSIISAMMAQLSPGRYWWQWLKYKISRPLAKVAQKFRRKYHSENRQ